MFYSGDAKSNAIIIYDGRGTNEPLIRLDKLHLKPVSIIKVRIIVLR